MGLGIMKRLGLAYRALTLQEVNWDVVYQAVNSGEVSVNEESVRSIAAVWSCANILCQTIGMIPLKVEQVNSDGVATEDVDHPLYKRLVQKPNGFQTSFQWRMLMMHNLCFRGNAYATAPQPAFNGEIIPLPVDNVRPFWADPKSREVSFNIAEYKIGMLPHYWYQAGGESTVFLPEEIIHIQGLSSNGLLGLAPIDELGDTFKSALHTRKFANSFYANGATVNAVIEHPALLGEEAAERIQDDFSDRFAGSHNAFKTPVLEEAMKYKPVGLTPEQSEFVATTNASVRDIARVFRIPPHMIADLEFATYSNIEQESINFAAQVMSPWVCNWEEVLAATLLTDRDRRDTRISFDMRGLLRADIATRYQSYETGLKNGFLTVNECRLMENLNPLEGGDQIGQVTSRSEALSN